jgi:hypothetical protein
LSIAALTRSGERASLAAIARVSKTVDAQEPEGISESAILHNDEAYALYRQHTPNKWRRQGRHAGGLRTNLVGNGRLRVNADRDHARARQRYLRASKRELVERLLAAEKAYAEIENRWLRTADDLLVWIMLVDRLITTTPATGSSC